MLKGVYSHDYIIQVFHRGKIIPTPRTVEAVFSFARHEDIVFLTIVEKKRIANFIANKLSEILFEKVGGVLEVRIPPETLKEFHLKTLKTPRSRSSTTSTFQTWTSFPFMDQT